MSNPLKTIKEIETTLEKLFVCFETLKISLINDNKVAPALILRREDLNENSKTLEVTFRTTSDSEEEIRESKINFDEIEEFGYNFFDYDNDYISLLDEDYEETVEDDFDDVYVDEQEIISFLNEYYTLYPSKLPSSEAF